MPARSELIAHEDAERNLQKQVRHCACVIKARITEIVLFRALLCAKVFVEQTTKQYRPDRSLEDVRSCNVQNRRRPVSYKAYRLGCRYNFWIAGRWRKRHF